MKGKVCPKCNFTNVQGAVCCGSCSENISTTAITNVEVKPGIHHTQNEQSKDLINKTRKLSSLELQEINRKAKIEGLKTLPSAVLFTILGFFLLTPSSREFASSVNFSPASSLTPLLNLVMIVVVPAIVVLYALFSWHLSLQALLKGASEADKERFVENKLKLEDPDAYRKEQDNKIVQLNCPHCSTITESAIKDLVGAHCNSCSNIILSNKVNCPCGSGKRFENCHGR